MTQELRDLDITIYLLTGKDYDYNDENWSELDGVHVIKGFDTLEAAEKEAFERNVADVKMANDNRWGHSEDPDSYFGHDPDALAAAAQQLGIPDLDSERLEEFFNNEVTEEQAVILVKTLGYGDHEVQPVPVSLNPDAQESNGEEAA